MTDINKRGEKVASKRLFVTKRESSWDCWLFMAPYLSVFFLFTFLPVIISIVISFTDFNMIQTPSFIGLRNYQKMFLADDTFLIALKNTFLFAMITGPVGYILCFLFAWLINEIPSKPRSLMTLLFYAPSIAGNMYVIWLFIFSGDSLGIVNGTLMRLGLILEPVVWLKDVRYMMPIIILVILWQSLGAGFLSFIAGLQTVDRTLFEAGAIDGIKNRWQELYFITLPSMKPQLMFGAIMSITSSFGIGGVITQLVGFPSTDYAAHTLVHHLEDYGGIRFEMGYASAIAAILFVMMIGANKLVQRLLKNIGS